MSTTPLGPQSMTDLAREAGVTLQRIGYYINGHDTAYALATGELPPRHDRSAPRNPLWNHYPCHGTHQAYQN